MNQLLEYVYYVPVLLFAFLGFTFWNVLFFPFAYYSLLKHNFKSNRFHYLLLTLFFYPFAALTILLIDYGLMAAHLFKTPPVLRNSNSKQLPVLQAH